MKKKEKPQDNFTLAHKRYESGYRYCQEIGFYSTVTENENYINGEQWGNVESNGLPTPVFNLEKRIMDYKISALASQRIKAVYGIEGVSQYPLDFVNETQDEQVEKELRLNGVAKMMSGNAEIRWERLKMDSLFRKWLRDGFVTGDFCAHTYWDSTIKTGSKFKGDIVTERVHPSCVFFGNPNEQNAQKQPWIILKTRKTVESLRREAKSYGVPADKIAQIAPDSDTDTQIGSFGQLEIDSCDASTEKCNAYLMYYRKDDGLVYWSLSTESVDIRTDVLNKTGSRYPVDWGNWDERENCYHGQSECAAIHPNQRFVNKMFAMCMIWFMYNSFGKIAFDATRISSWTNEIGVAIPVQGSIDGVVQQLASGDFNSAVLTVIDKAIAYTKECQGVTDAALGIERADNTSALVIAQKASALPLENQQARIYQFVEDIFLTWSEYMLNYYIEGRNVPSKDADGNIVYKPFTKEDAENLVANVKIDVGASSYWSEITSMDTLSNLLREQYITFGQYLERLPNGYLMDKQKLLDEWRAIAQNAPDMGENQSQEQGQDFEMEAAFFDGLPFEMQQQLQALPPEQMESEIRTMMQATPS